MCQASQPAERNARMAIAERTPMRHWKTTRLLAGIVSARLASRSSSMCTAPGIRPASHS